MPYREGDKPIPGFEVVRFIPGGPLSERYVIRDEYGVTYEIELVASSAETPEIAKLAYRSLLFVGGLSHPCLPKGEGTVAVPTAAEGRSRTLREVPLWEHLSGALTLHQLLESAGPLHPAQAADIILQVAEALTCVEIASRNSTGNPFPHLVLTPANIMVRENRTPVVVGWANRAASLASHKPSFPYPRFATFLDPLRPQPDRSPDRRHDTYGLAACLFFLVRGHPLPYHLKPSDRSLAAAESLPPILGPDLAKIVAQALHPELEARPSVETLAAALSEARAELESTGRGEWKVCAGCGLLLRHDPDLCPLCIRDRIVPAREIPPPVLAPRSLAPPISVNGEKQATGLEEIGALLPKLVQRASEEKRPQQLESALRSILLALVERGLREFVGDLVTPSGGLTGDPYWVASELAHRIDPEVSDRVYIAREKGWFLRYLRGRERSFLYRKTLREELNLGGIRIDIAFRGRLYLFTARADGSLWNRLRRVRRHAPYPIVVVVLRGNVPPVPPDLLDCVSVYAGYPPRPLARGKGPGWVDEYGLFCFLRGPLSQQTVRRQ